jgi:hypothetical protein
MLLPLSIEENMLLFVYAALNQGVHVNLLDLSGRFVEARKAKLLSEDHYSGHLAEYLGILIKAGWLQRSRVIFAYDATPYGCNQIEKDVKRIIAKNPLRSVQLLTFLQDSTRT